MIELYRAKKTSRKPTLDGSLAAEPWLSAARSPSFVDMASGEPALYDTKAAILWDEEALYVGLWVEEPFPTGHHTEEDSLIFQENDVEVFIDGVDCYYELELNCLNTRYEVFFIWRDSYARFASPEFSLHDGSVYSFGGDYDRTPDHFWKGTHPRGPRWAFLDWNFHGLRTAVHIEGKVNDRSMRSKGWTVEIAFPWSGMKQLAQGRSLPPNPGDVWNLFLGRFQKVPIAGEAIQAAWCLTPHGVYDTHMPEKFTPVVFES